MTAVCHLEFSNFGVLCAMIDGHLDMQENLQAAGTPLRTLLGSSQRCLLPKKPVMRRSLRHSDLASLPLAFITPTKKLWVRHGAIEAIVASHFGVLLR